jgi:hypothetical protein
MFDNDFLFPSEQLLAIQTPPWTGIGSLRRRMNASFRSHPDIAELMIMIIILK